MNALRNFWSRPLCLLRQSGQNAIVNLTTSTPIENAVPLKEERPSLCNLQPRTNNSLFVPSDVKFIGKKFQTLRPGQISPTTLKKWQRMQRKVEIVYRCNLCNTRNSKYISEYAYTSGVVILQCDGCGVDHLIKDNLGWFANTKGKSFDQVLAENGDSIKIIKVNQHGELI